MGDFLNDNMVIDLDLNEEPSEAPDDPALRVVSLFTEVGLRDDHHIRIEDRIRRLEAVTARASQRQRWRQARNNPETSFMPVEVEQISNERSEFGMINGEGGEAVQEWPGERGRSCKRDSSHLVAKALEMDLDVKKDAAGSAGGSVDGGSFYDCNICLDMARDPIVTCCGHLFCWSCFYQLEYVDSSAKECPVCKGEVTDSTVTPIYGNGKDSQVFESESGVKIPPRPKARRVESIRQQRASRGISHIPVAEALRRIRIGIGSIGQSSNARQQGSETGPPTVLPNFVNPEAGTSRRGRSRQVTRVLSESAASLSSISLALNNAERLVEDLETYINGRLIRRTDAQFLPVQDLVTPVSAVTDVQSEDQTAATSTEINPTVLPSSSSSSRRRSGASRASGSEVGHSRELRRRRLR